MKKALIALLIVVCFCLTAEAKTYITIHKTTGEPLGMASIADKDIANWAKDFILVEADSSYRGKYGYEIIYENGELRHATEQEISDYLAQQEQAQQDTIKAKKKQELLDLLEDEDVVDKIKDKIKP